MTSGNNLSSLRMHIKDKVDRIRSLKNDREGTNADISAIIEELEAKGVNRHAFRKALAYMDMDPQQRRNFDFAYELVRESIGLPIQADLFEEPKGDGQDDAPEKALDVV